MSARSAVLPGASPPSRFWVLRMSLASMLTAATSFTMHPILSVVFWSTCRSSVVLPARGRVGGAGSVSRASLRRAPHRAALRGPLWEVSREQLPAAAHLIGASCPNGKYPIQTVPRAARIEAQLVQEPQTSQCQQRPHRRPGSRTTCEQQHGEAVSCGTVANAEGMGVVSQALTWSQGSASAPPCWSCWP